MNTTDHSQMKLGRKGIKRDTRTLLLAAYLPLMLPTPPSAVAWSPGVKSPWAMLCNDRIGDCTIAGALHLEQAWSANSLAPSPFVPTWEEALSDYERIDGYNPADPSTDQGGVLLDVLNAWRQTGVAGRKIAGYASADAGNLTEIRQAIAIFGGIYCGVTLPISAQTQDVWDVAADDGGVWGGHCVPILDYDENGLTCITWGATKRMTWEFFSKYFDEAYPVVSKDFIEASGFAPSGFNLQQLLTDIKAIH